MAPAAVCRWVTAVSDITGHLLSAPVLSFIGFAEGIFWSPVGVARSWANTDAAIQSIEQLVITTVKKVVLDMFSPRIVDEIRNRKCGKASRHIGA
jgi:hypothetical protein